MKIKMSRNITNKVHWFLDNILPPIIRENTFCMGVLAYIIYGKYGKYYLNFKESGKYLTMSDDEIKEYYEMIEPLITRPTDINSKCQNKLFENCSKWNHLKILDISCGRGWLSLELAQRCPETQIYGCDINIPEELKKKETGNLHFVEGNALNLPFEDNEFDVVISTHTLEHIVDAKRAYLELRRVCKNKLIIIIPGQREYKYTMDFHVQFWPYTHSFLQFTGNYNAYCEKIDHDIYYEENI